MRAVNTVLLFYALQGTPANNSLKLVSHFLPYLRLTRFVFTLLIKAVDKTKTPTIIFLKLTLFLCKRNNGDAIMLLVTCDCIRF